VTSRPTFDEYFLMMAETASLRSDCERDKVGAVIVNNQRIRSTGYNGAPAGRPGCKSCPRRLSNVAPGSSYDNCVAIHAEANALLYCDRVDLIGATLYVTREPCYGCRKLINGAGVERIVTPSSAGQYAFIHDHQGSEETRPVSDAYKIATLREAADIAPMRLPGRLGVTAREWLIGEANCHEGIREAGEALKGIVDGIAVERPEPTTLRLTVSTLDAACDFARALTGEDQ